MRPAAGLVLQPVLERSTLAVEDALHDRGADDQGVVGMQHRPDLVDVVDLVVAIAGQVEDVLRPLDAVVARFVGPGADASRLRQQLSGAFGGDQPRVQLALARGVSDHPDHVAVGEQLGAALEPAPAAVLGADARGVVAVALVLQALKVRLDAGFFARMDEVAGVLAHDLSLRPAGLPLEGRIDQLEPLVRADDEHHLAAVLEQPLDDRLRFLRCPPCGHRPRPFVQRAR